MYSPGNMLLKRATEEDVRLRGKQKADIKHLKTAKGTVR